MVCYPRINYIEEVQQVCHFQAIHILAWNLLFLNCDTGFAFYFERELYFFLTRKTVFSKKTALSCIFFRISIDNLGPYMCYTIILIYSHSL